MGWGVVVGGLVRAALNAAGHLADVVRAELPVRRPPTRPSTLSPRVVPDPINACGFAEYLRRTGGAP